jgi:integrase
MGRTRDRLTALQVKNAPDGWYNDGGNLHLRVGNEGKSKKWVLRYVRDGKAVEIGLGGADRVSLKQARKLRDGHLDDLAAGLDPRAEKRKQAAARLSRKTFAQAAAEIIEARRLKKWRVNGSDGRQSSFDDWTKSLTVDCKPISDRYVGEIDTDEIEPIVKRYWDRGHAASTRRLLNRIETVFDYAKAKKWRTADNPATWALFEHILQAKGPTGPQPHHPALNWQDVPAFMALVRAGQPSMPALALELTILTAARPGEVRGMTWDEIDLDAAVWTVPAVRMKRGRLHEVPLSTDAVALITRLEAARINKFVFPGRRSKGPLTHYPVWTLVQRLTGRDADKPSAASPHGFRASFRSWCRAKKVPNDVAERCLAHERKDATQAAYDREEMLDARRPVMERWARFLANAESDAKVVALSGRRKRS